MQVHGYGEIIWCREVIFENGKYDRLGIHPGIVMLPTSENEEAAYCLHMTSNQKRISRNKRKYVECRAAVKKGTYINIEHIIKRNNNMDSSLIDEMSDNEFLELLKEFYDYQIHLRVPEKDFLDIKYKVEVLIELLKVNDKLKMEQAKIRYDKLNRYLSVNDIKRVNKIYLAELLLKYKDLTHKTNKKCFLEDKDIIYAKKMLEVYEQLKKVEYSKVDFNNPNNEIREIYIDSRQNNYLLNTDTLFYDVIELFKVTDNNLNYNKFIIEFMKHEKAKQQEHETNGEEKLITKAEEKIREEK